MSVQTRTPRSDGRLSRLWLVIAGIVVAAVLIAASIWVMDALTPQFIDAITIDNPTEHTVQVHANGSNGDGWLTVGTVPAGQTKQAHRVVDLGQTWTFRFSRRDVGVEATYSRSELNAQSWQVTVPDDLEQRLEQQGIQPPGSPFD